MSKQVKHWRPYVEYLERLADKREDAGLPPAVDIYSEEYWRDRERWRAEKQLPLFKAA
jgi:hypothetical protein